MSSATSSDTDDESSATRSCLDFYQTPPTLQKLAILRAAIHLSRNDAMWGSGIHELPKPFFNTLMAECQAMRVHRMNAWRSAFIRQLFDLDNIFYDHDDCIVWYGNDGRINEVETVKRILKNPALSKNDMYKIMCAFCLEDELRDLLATGFLPSSSKTSLRDFENYWNKRLIENINPYFKPYTIFNNRTAAEYFLRRAKDCKLPRMVRDLVQKEVFISPKLILTRLDERQQNEVFGEIGYLIMIRLIDELFLEEAWNLWFRIRSLVTGRDFMTLVNKILSCTSGTAILPTLWTNTPTHLKKFARSHRAMDFLGRYKEENFTDACFHFFNKNCEIITAESVEMMIELHPGPKTTSSSDREKDPRVPFCLKLFEQGALDNFYEFVKRGISNDTDVFDYSMQILLESADGGKWCVDRACSGKDETLKHVIEYVSKKKDPSISSDSLNQTWADFKSQLMEIDTMKKAISSTFSQGLKLSHPLAVFFWPNLSHIPEAGSDPHAELLNLWFHVRDIITVKHFITLIQNIMKDYATDISILPAVWKNTPDHFKDYVLWRKGNNFIDGCFRHFSKCKKAANSVEMMIELMSHHDKTASSTNHDYRKSKLTAAYCLRLLEQDAFESFYEFVERAFSNDIDVFDYSMQILLKSSEGVKWCMGMVSNKNGKTLERIIEFISRKKDPSISDCSLHQTVTKFKSQLMEMDTVKKDISYAFSNDLKIDHNFSSFFWPRSSDVAKDSANSGHQHSEMLNYWFYIRDTMIEKDFAYLIQNILDTENISFLPVLWKSSPDHLKDFVVKNKKTNFVDDCFRYFAHRCKNASNSVEMMIELVLHRNTVPADEDIDYRKSNFTIDYCLVLLKQHALGGYCEFVESAFSHNVDILDYLSEILLRSGDGVKWCMDTVRDNKGETLEHIVQHVARRKNPVISDDSLHQTVMNFKSYLMEVDTVKKDISVTFSHDLKRNHNYHRVKVYTLFFSPHLSPTAEDFVKSVCTDPKYLDEHYSRMLTATSSLNAIIDHCVSQTELANSLKEMIATNVLRRSWKRLVDGFEFEEAVADKIKRFRSSE